MGIYLYCSGTVSADLAETALRDWLSGGSDCLAVEPNGDCDWAMSVIDALGLTRTPFVPNFTSADTVIAPADADDLEDILKAGAVVLDLSEGLVPLELVDETPVADVPDIPEDLPEPVLEEPDPVHEPKKREPRKKPSLPPAAKLEETTVVLEAPSEEVISAVPPAPKRKRKTFVDADIPAAQAAVDEAIQESEESPLLAGTKGIMDFLPPSPPAVGNILRELAHRMVDETEEENLWKVVDLLRGH
jgi:hypothetical protein